MSQLTAGQLTRVAAFLEALETATSNTGIEGTYYGEAGLKVDDVTLRVRYDEKAGEYVVDDV